MDLITRLPAARNIVITMNVLCVLPNLTSGKRYHQPKHQCRHPSHSCSEQHNDLCCRGYLPNPMASSIPLPSMSVECTLRIPSLPNPLTGGSNLATSIQSTGAKGL